MEWRRGHEKLKEAITHLAFAIELCHRQRVAGRRFMLEHLAGASSWKATMVDQLVSALGCVRVNFDFCMAGMLSHDFAGDAPARKRTGAVTNCMHVAKELARLQCDNSHRHVHLVDGRARECQNYPENFCEMICKAVLKAKSQQTDNAEDIELAGFMSSANCAPSW